MLLLLGLNSIYSISE